MLFRTSYSHQQLSSLGANRNNGAPTLSGHPPFTPRTFATREAVNIYTQQQPGAERWAHPPHYFAPKPAFVNATITPIRPGKRSVASAANSNLHPRGSQAAPRQNPATPALPKTRSDGQLNLLQHQFPNQRRTTTPSQTAAPTGTAQDRTQGLTSPKGLLGPTHERAPSRESDNAAVDSKRFLSQPAGGNLSENDSAFRDDDGSSAVDEPTLNQRNNDSSLNQGNPPVSRWRPVQPAPLEEPESPHPKSLIDPEPPQLTERREDSPDHSSQGLAEGSRKPADAASICAQEEEKFSNADVAVAQPEPVVNAEGNELPQTVTFAEVPRGLRESLNANIQPNDLQKKAPEKAAAPLGEIPLQLKPPPVAARFAATNGIAAQDLDIRYAAPALEFPVGSPVWCARHQLVTNYMCKFNNKLLCAPDDWATVQGKIRQMVGLEKFYTDHAEVFGLKPRGTSYAHLVNNDGLTKEGMRAILDHLDKTYKLPTPEHPKTPEQILDEHARLAHTFTNMKSLVGNETLSRFWHGLRQTGEVCDKLALLLGNYEAHMSKSVMEAATKEHAEKQKQYIQLMKDAGLPVETIPLAVVDPAPDKPKGTPGANSLPTSTQIARAVYTGSATYNVFHALTGTYALEEAEQGGTFVMPPLLDLGPIGATAATNLALIPGAIATWTGRRDAAKTAQVEREKAAVVEKAEQDLQAHLDQLKRCIANDPVDTLHSLKTEWAELEADWGPRSTWHGEEQMARHVALSNREKEATQDVTDLERILGIKMEAWRPPPEHNIDAQDAPTLAEMLAPKLEATELLQMQLGIQMEMRKLQSLSKEMEAEGKEKALDDRWNQINATIWRSLLAYALRITKMAGATVPLGMGNLASAAYNLWESSVRLKGQYDPNGLKYATDSIAVARSRLSARYPETDKALSYTTRILESTAAQLNRNYRYTGYAKAVQSLMVMASMVAGAALTGGPGALLVPVIIGALSSAVGAGSVTPGQTETIQKQRDDQVNKITQEYGSMVAGFETGAILSQATSTSPVQMAALSNCVDDYIRAVHAEPDLRHTKAEAEKKGLYYIETMHSVFKTLGATPEILRELYQSAQLCKLPPLPADDESQPKDPLKEAAAQAPRPKDPLKETMVQTLRLLLLETTAFNANQSRKLAEDLGYTRTTYRDLDRLRFNRQLTQGLSRSTKYA